MKNIFCIDCFKQLSINASYYGYKRCSSCAQKHLRLTIPNPMTGIRRFKQDSPHWKGGKPKCLDCGKQLSSYKSKRCNHCNKVGNKNPMFNKAGFKNKNHTEQTKQLISLSVSGEKHPNWQGGIAYDERQKEFFLKRDFIRQRDNYTCQNFSCNMTEEEHLIVYGLSLSVHHIDYNKKNNEDINLISLCNQCNARANYNRDYWQKLYQEKIQQIYEMNKEKINGS